MLIDGLQQQKREIKKWQNASIIIILIEALFMKETR